jgi:membrane-bound lytic murein transglycosylase D
MRSLVSAAARAIALLCLAVASLLGAPAAPARAEGFPMPPSIVPRVDFWTRVYSEVGTNGGLIHDSEDLSRIYEVVKTPAGSSERTVDGRVNEAKARARAALQKLASGQRQNLSSSERRVLAQFPPDVSSQTLRAAAERVRFQRGQADKFRAGLERMGRWESHVRRALRERGVPEDLKALPHVESSYNPDAYSHAGASGLWQFTRPTGRIYMRVDHIVDERRDPFLASDAAARLLRSNYERLATWPLAITAYNHGPGGMAKAVRTHGTRDIGVIVNRYRSPSFGFASKNFYTEFLAARRIDQNPERYFGPIRKEAPWDHESVVLRKSYGVSALSAALRIPSAELRDWNPALLAPVWSGSRSVPASYELRVPRRAGHAPASQLVAGIQGEGYRGAPAEVARSEGGARATAAGGVHRVQRGETLGEIAQRHGIPTAELAELNGIRDARRIREGQILELPGSGGEAAPASGAEPSGASPAAAAGATPAAVATIHRVARGDTLLAIARRYGVGMAAIAARNEIRDPRDLREGQTLEIPIPASAEVPAGEATLAQSDPAPAAETPPAPPAAGAAEAAGEPEPAPSPEPAAASPAEPAPLAEAAPSEAAPSAEPTVVAAAEPSAAAEPDPPAPRSYTIAAGDTLGSIGRRFDVASDELAAANGISDPRSLRPGQVLRLPAGGAAGDLAAEAAPEPEAAQAPAEAPAPRSYTVAPGDTLGSIARRFGVGAQELAAANGVSDPRRLRPGQSLELPSGAAAAADVPPAPPPERLYTVRPGDTLYSIAARHGVRVADIAERNSLKSRHKLSIGQRLRLPPGANAAGS